MDKEDVVAAIHDALESRAKVNNELHTEHHAFIESLIKREERKSQMWQKIKTQVLGWGILGVVGAIGTAVYHTFFNVPPAP